MKRKSETASKKHRRGRPPAFSIGEDAKIKQAWGDLISTQRSVRNKQFAAIGARAIYPDGQPNARYAWLATASRVRQSVLVELGRIARKQGNEAALAMANVIVKMVEVGEITTTRQAEKVLREKRMKISEAASEKSRPNGTATGVHHGRRPRRVDDGDALVTGGGS